MRKELIVLGEEIKKFRKRRGFSQEKLAEISGLHRTYISDIERGQRNVSFLNLVKIANALGISLCELFRGIEL